MNETAGESVAPSLAVDLRAGPFLRAPEASRSIFLVIMGVAAAPLAAGAIFFGWRSLAITALAVGGCVAVESAYYRITRTPALHGRTHAALTGMLLALTLPPFVEWYVPLVGAVFAIVVGKAIFGGVGHFLWQPALVGRLAVTVLFAPPLFAANLLNPSQWPVLAESRILLGDVTEAGATTTYRQWRGTPPPPGRDAFALTRPRDMLRRLTVIPLAPPEAITDVLRHMPPAWDLICGAHGGGIGETCAIVILVAGLYLIYRNYVRAHVPGLFLLAAAVTAAIAPIRAGPAGEWQLLPIISQGLDVGFAYVSYHILCGELMLAAWFMATEMTSRPVTAPAQAVFGILCGVLAMLGRLYTDFPIPAYAAVLVCNTLTPFLDVVRPRVLGQRRFWQR